MRSRAHGSLFLESQCDTRAPYQSVAASPPPPLLLPLELPLELPLLLPLLLPLELPLLLPPPSPPPPHDVVLPSAHVALEPADVHAILYVDAMPPVIASAPLQ